MTAPKIFDHAALLPLWLVPGTVAWAWGSLNGYGPGHWGIIGAACLGTVLSLVFEQAVMPRLLRAARRSRGSLSARAVGVSCYTGLGGLGLFMASSLGWV